ncbi:hypothetical protein IW262DRAFT_1452552 [Armillaria fumosa]|nr:hypothetical protein IW262DRAFT_1452552 [Armillaria fumosa]
MDEEVPLDLQVFLYAQLPPPSRLASPFMTRHFSIMLRRALASTFMTRRNMYISIMARQGLDGQLGPRANSQEMFDRKAAGMIIKTAQEGRIARRAMLFSGPSSTGKTGIELGMLQMLGLDVPPTVIAASTSDIFSLSISKMETL